MARMMTPAQYNAWVRQQEAARRQAIQRYNAEVDRVNRANKAAAEKAVRDYNREVDRFNRESKAEADRVNRHNRQVVDNYNREVRRVNEHNRAAVNKYNQAVRAHNAQVSRDRQQRASRLAALRAQPTTHYVEVRNSTYDLNARYDRLEQNPGYFGSAGDLQALSEQEAANSAVVAEALTAEAPVAPEQVQDSGILEYLAGFSQDLCDRWKGALYALNPVNTDAARHFCTSVREIFTEILEKWADNKDVVEADAACEKTPNGTPSRRAKIRYLLKRKGADTPEMLGFVEQDIEDILQLFKVFNEATHGAAGKHGFAKLQAIRKRVEGGIMFLATVAL